MSSSSSSLFSSPDKVFIASLGLGLASSSFAFWGNVALRLVGTVPVVSCPLNRSKMNVDHRQAAKVFAWFYRSAAPLFVGSVLTTAISLLVAARNLPVLSPAPSLWRLLHWSALSTSLMFPFTILVLAPINRRLLAIADADADVVGPKGKPAELSTQEKDQVQEDLKRWVRFNDVRITFAAVGWALAASAAILA